MRMSECGIYLRLTAFCFTNKNLLNYSMLILNKSMITDDLIQSNNK